MKIKNKEKWEIELENKFGCIHLLKYGKEKCKGCNLENDCFYKKDFEDLRLFIKGVYKMKPKNKYKIRKCGNCNNWYAGCYETDYDFWKGNRDASNCKYFEEKTVGEMKLWQVNYWDYIDDDIYFQIKAKNYGEARKKAIEIIMSKIEYNSNFIEENLQICRIREG